MFIIGCNFHTRFRQIAMVNTTKGEIIERRSQRENGKARAFYVARSGPARLGMKATGYAQ
jgi:hypothetical protein